jgi:alcohol oxidase
MGAYTAYPYSRGSIHITDKENFVDGYNFDTGFLSHPSDLKKQLWAYKMSREIARRLPYCSGELELGHPKFKADSTAALTTYNHDNGEIRNIEYSKEDDEAIEDWIRGNLNTTWHSLGTCAMRAREKGGVVDKDLNVYVRKLLYFSWKIADSSVMQGTNGLKVADLSIVPQNVGANTNNTALAVGEKAAIIIGNELGIKV